MKISISQKLLTEQTNLLNMVIKNMPHKIFTLKVSLSLLLPYDQSVLHCIYIIRQQGHLLEKFCI